MQTESYFLPSKNGFTLIELAIVLVIIGLILGGILVGRDLIKAAEMRSLAKQIDEIKTAVQAFKLKYNCLPGDCPNATQFLSSTGNGNGNGNIGDFLAPPQSEPYRFWQHLGSSGLIGGTYTGSSTSGGSAMDAIAGVNILKSSFSDSVGYFVQYHDRSSDGDSAEYWGAINYGNHIKVGVPTTNTGSTAYYEANPFLTTIEAKNFDEKYDDGHITTGLVMATGSNFTGNGYCYIGSPPDYYTSASGIRCNLMFLRVF